MREVDEFDWAREQTCVPLANDREVAVARVFAAAHQLPLHNDRWKNWDNFLAVHHAHRLCERGDAVLDAGACRDPASPSVFLPGLKKLGHTDLYGCNLDEIGQVEVDGIKYSHQDITWSTYTPDTFKFAACLSVIEHGVDFRRFFQEMRRIVAPGGFLFTSFDFWRTKVDTKGQMAFGVPIKIFDASDVMQMCVYATQLGFHVMKRPDLVGKDAPVEWMGMKYTFMNLLMRAEAK